LIFVEETNMFWTGFCLGMAFGSVIGVVGLAMFAINVDHRR